MFQGHSPSTIHSLIDSHSFIHITFMPGMLTVTVKVLENQGAWKMACKGCKLGWRVILLAFSEMTFPASLIVRGRPYDWVLADGCVLLAGMAHKIPPYEMISFCPHRWLDGENLGYRSMEMGEAQVPESLCGSLSIKQLQRIVRGTRNKLVLSLGLGVSVCAVCAQSFYSLWPARLLCPWDFFQARILDPLPEDLPHPGIETMSLTSPSL